MKFLLSLFLLCTSLIVHSQVGINAQGDPPHPSAMFDVSSTDKGLLPPRMSQEQRNAIPAPIPAGLTIFNTTTGCTNVHNGVSWRQICGDCDFSNPVLSSNAPVCEGGTLNLQASLVPDATYAWTGPNGFNSTDQNPGISSALVANGGT